QTAVVGLCRNAACQPSGDPPPLAMIRRLHKTGADELPHGGHRDTDMTANANEADSSLSDETPREPLGRSQQVGDFGNSQKAIRLRYLGWGHHAALPVAGSSAARASRARRLASVSACSQWSRSATACRSLLAGGR